MRNKFEKQIIGIAAEWGKGAKPVASWKEDRALINWTNSALRLMLFLNNTSLHCVNNMFSRSMLHGNRLCFHLILIIIQQSNLDISTGLHTEPVDYFEKAIWSSTPRGEDSRTVEVYTQQIVFCIWDRWLHEQCKIKQVQTLLHYPCKNTAVLLC